MLGDVVFLTISIHAPREGCDFAPRNDGGMWVISIHAPREGCDCQNQGSSSRMDYFNPRTPRGVRRQRVCTISMGNRNFNPRTPRGVRQVADGPPGDCVIISIHAPREGCDKAPLAGGTKERNFNPRTPRGVRRSVMRSSICSNSISIHAPREGCDERPCCTSETGAFLSAQPENRPYFEGCADIICMIRSTITAQVRRNWFWRRPSS